MKQAMVVGEDLAQSFRMPREHLHLGVAAEGGASADFHGEHILMPRSNASGETGLSAG